MMFRSSLVIFLLCCSLVCTAELNKPFFSGMNLGNPAVMLPDNDPVRHIADDHSLRFAAYEMIKALKNNSWDHRTLRSPEGYDVNLYAYVHQLISKQVFLDVQDYLQLQTDYASPETIEFDMLLENGKIPARLKAKSVRRVHYSEFTDEALRPWHKDKVDKEIPQSQQWLTQVVISKDDVKKYVIASGFANHNCDSEKRSQPNMHCYAHVLPEKDSQLWVWNRVLSHANREIYNRKTIANGDVELLFANVNIKISQTEESNLELIPLYGSLEWSHLNNLREHRKNPGTIYHPDVTNNYFQPHGLYGGASIFLRHDLFHHSAVGKIPERHRRFLIWLHKKEQAIIEQMDQDLIAVDYDALDASYNSSLTYQRTQLSRLCHSLYKEGDDLALAGNGSGNVYWSDTSLHRSLFEGIFADMDHISVSTFRGNCQGYPDDECDSHHSASKSFIELLSRQCKNSGLTFPASFKIYHGLLEDIIHENSDYILQNFGIEVDNMMLELRYTQGY